LVFFINNLSHKKTIDFIFAKSSKTEASSAGEQLVRDSLMTDKKS